jgi:cation diffusion facilitator CzcD-associated flavoprotein CzcO
MQNYDAVVVATGRYNAPNVPAISGLEEWNKKFPGHLLHSRQYRRPQPFKGKTVLVIGAAVGSITLRRTLLLALTEAVDQRRRNCSRGYHTGQAGICVHSA